MRLNRSEPANDNPAQVVESHPPSSLPELDLDDYDLEAEYERLGASEEAEPLESEQTQAHVALPTETEPEADLDDYDLDDELELQAHHVTSGAPSVQVEPEDEDEAQFPEAAPDNTAEQPTAPPAPQPEIAGEAEPEMDPYASEPEEQHEETHLDSQPPLEIPPNPEPGAAAPEITPVEIPHTADQQPVVSSPEAPPAGNPHDDDPELELDLDDYDIEDHEHNSAASNAAPAEAQPEIELHQHSEQLHCVPCSKRQVPKESSAVAFCVDCSKAFCEGCIAAHDIVIEGHTTRMLAIVLPQPAVPEAPVVLPAELPPSAPPVPVIDNLKCQHHSTREIEAFCALDFTLVCSACVLFGDHQGHKCMSLTDAIEALGIQLLIEDAKTRRAIFLDAAQALQREQQLVQSRLGECVQQLELSRTAVLAGLAQVVNSTFDGLVGEANALSSTKLQLLHEQETVTSGYASEMGSLVERITQLGIAGDNARLLDSRHQLHTTVENSRTLVLAPKAISDVEVVTPPVEAAIHALMQTHRLGYVYCRDVDASQSALEGQKELDIGKVAVLFVAWRTSEGQPAKNAMDTAITTQVEGAIRVCSVSTSQDVNGWVVSRIEVTADAELSDPALLHVFYRGAEVRASPKQLVTAVSTRSVVSGALLDACRNYQMIPVGQAVSLDVDVVGSDAQAFNSPAGVELEAYSDDAQGGNVLRNVGVIRKGHSKYELVFAPTDVGSRRVHVLMHGKPLPLTPLIAEVNQVVSCMTIHGGSIVLFAEWMREILRDMLPLNRRTLTKLMDSNDGRHSKIYPVIMFVMFYLLLARSSSSSSLGNSPRVRCRFLPS